MGLNMKIFSAISALTQYGINKKLIEPEDRVYTINQICQALNLDTFEDTAFDEGLSLEEILSSILDYAVEKGLCENSVVYRDLFDTKIMGILTPRPSQVIKEFEKQYKKSPVDATNYYYDLAFHCVGPQPMN